MDKTRRKFLKIAGLSAAAGVGAPTGLEMLLGKNAGAATSGEGGHAASNEEQSPGKHGEESTGKRYGMVIDVMKFHDNPGMAEKCIEACHSYHNVPDFGNKKDEIKWIWTEKYANAFPGHSQYKMNSKLQGIDIPVLCNHCDDPPCVRACPTKATFKNEDGIVMMDFHRCIGCRFCMAACPYGARSFNWRDPRGSKDGSPFIEEINDKFPTRMRGVVEKCSLCAWRLSSGKEPLCVEATGDTKAMIFGDLNDPGSEINQVLKSRFTIQRKPSLGTKPSIFYII